MKLRTRIALLVSAAVAVTIILASVAAYFATRSQLRGEVDDDLRQRAALAARAADLSARARRRIMMGPLVDIGVFFQVVDEGGAIARPPNQLLELPVDDRVLAVADGAEAGFLSDATISDVHLRVATVPAGPGLALQLARSLEEVDDSLRGLAATLVFVSLAGAAVALLLGLAIAGGALAPLARLTRTAEHVTETQDLEAPIAVERDDEVGRLAAAFNAMLGALAESRRQQQRLVTDAGHELRTPLTSLRTNLEVLARAEGMDPEERRRLLADVTHELEELSGLVAELVELAREPRAAEEEIRDVRLDEVVDEVVERARRRTGQRIELEAAPSLVRGRPTMLERAAANLVDNACKWNPEGRPIEVLVSGGRVEVRDHGPGIDDADLPHVFDRFYRSSTARSMPGSGLGLAIVKQVVEGHGGRVWAEAASGGGALVGFEIPEDAETAADS